MKKWHVAIGLVLCGLFYAYYITSPPKILETFWKKEMVVKKARFPFPYKTKYGITEGFFGEKDWACFPIWNGFGIKKARIYYDDSTVIMDESTESKESNYGGRYITPCIKLPEKGTVFIVVTDGLGNETWTVIKVEEIAKR